MSLTERTEFTEKREKALFLFFSLYEKIKTILLSVGSSELCERVRQSFSDRK